MFLLVPVLGFILLELPHLTAYSVTERVLLAWGLTISALLSAHGVLCCDAAEHAEHASRERLDAEKNATKCFTSYILHEVRVPFNVVRAGIDTLDASLAAGALRGADAGQHAGAEEMLAAMTASANHMIRCVGGARFACSAEARCVLSCNTSLQVATLRFATCAHAACAPAPQCTDRAAPRPAAS